MKALTNEGPDHAMHAQGLHMGLFLFLYYICFIGFKKLGTLG